MEPTKTVWILSGAPGAGKSTWAFENLEPNSEIVSRDRIRFSLLGREDEYFNCEHEVWRRYVQQAQEALCDDSIKNVYLDATHISENSRNKILTAIDSAFVPRFNIIVVYFDVCFAVCCERNSRREGRSRVPEPAIRRMLNLFQTPTFNEKYKYEEIWRVDAQGNVTKEKNKNVCSSSI